jgi:hypothetical protein
MRQLTITAGRLASTADALHPLAIQLGGVAPGLATATAELPAFLKQATAAANAARPTIRTATTFLHGGGSTFSALTAGLASAERAAPPTANLVTTLAQVMPLISDSLFQDVASQTSEPGNEPFDPEDPLRNYWRGAAVLSCETFGLAIKPGCLAGLGPSGLIRSRTSANRHSRSLRLLHHPATPVPTQPPSSPAGTPNGRGVGSVVQHLLGTLLPQGGGPPGQTTTTGSGSAGTPKPQPLSTLLKYLLSR